MPRRWASTPVTEQRYEHAEGPSWDRRSGLLTWVDQFPGLVCVGDYDAATRALLPVRTYEVGSAVGAVVPTTEPGGGWLVACGAGFAHLALDGTVTTLAQPETTTEPPMRMNDGKCDADGRFWAGSMAWDKSEGHGSLFRLEPDLTVTVMLTGLTISNGLAWSADGRQMYFIDTPTRRVDRLTVGADSSVSDRRPAVELEAGAGFPDGMCIDDEGCVWVALWDGWSVRRYSPSGELLAVVEVDAPQVTSCCFGGPEGRTLFVTTSQEDMDAPTRDRYEHAGRLFSVEVDVSGLPAATFEWPPR